ncbi:15-cis-phytoene desaturase [Massilia sp. Bi118]|uniref:hydroxysqualene dehydroxylase n=1 Tax=Massilia sp. Bi118 TaxID=2822346 RepID=UPI001D3C223B|nr:FAD-dependent oxidoreductase [Massilia sp. Bi118]CAH0247441.1 15-cis-phytoene desaturase [Massilia sp. Bi118]
MNQEQVVVIGGGLAGLSCAVALADQGLKVTVLEAAPGLGGRASSWAEANTGDVVDIGPHIFHSEYHNMTAFLERMGTSRLITWQPRKVLTIASKPDALPLKHAPLPPPLSLMPSILKAPGLHLEDYLSMAKVAMRGMEFGEEEVDKLDAESALDFLRRKGVSEDLIDWWWRFAAMVVTNVPLERCSAASLLRIHAQLSGYRELHFGFGAVGLGELYTDQATKIIEDAGGRVLTGTKVASLLLDRGVDGVLLEDGTKIFAETVVSAVPPQQLFEMLPPSLAAQAPFALCDSFEPSPYISCYLWFDRELKTERFFSHLWSPRRLNYDFYDLCQIRHGWQGRPTVIASNIIYSHRAQGMSDEDIVRETIGEISEFAPLAAQAKVVHADIHRITMAIPCPTVGFERKRPAARTSVPGLMLAGDWTRTHVACTMEGAVKSGFTAAEQVLAERGQDVQLAIPSREYDGIAGMVRNAAAGKRGVSPAPE